MQILVNLGLLMHIYDYLNKRSNAGNVKSESCLHSYCCCTLKLKLPFLFC